MSQIFGDVFIFLCVIGIRVLGTVWINREDGGGLFIDDILTLTSFIIGSLGLAKFIKHFGRDNKMCLSMSMVLSFIAIVLVVVADILLLTRENYTIDRDTAIKVPFTFGLYAYLCAESFENIRRNGKLIWDAWKMLNNTRDNASNDFNGEEQIV